MFYIDISKVDVMLLQVCFKELTRLLNCGVSLNSHKTNGSSSWFPSTILILLRGSCLHTRTEFQDSYYPVSLRAVAPLGPQQY